jgi:hypothetical protein
VRRLATGLSLLFVCVAGLACNTQLLTQTNVLDEDSSLSGSTTGFTTASFSVASTWDLTYTYDCRRQLTEKLVGANGFEVIVYNADDRIPNTDLSSGNSEHPDTVVVGKKGSSTIHFKRGGTFYLKVASLCDWRVSVVDTAGSH